MRLLRGSLPAEEWRTIPGRDGYEVSSWGRVRGPRGGVLRLQYCKSGYAWFKVSNGRGSCTNVSVARAVCAAFHGQVIGLDSEHENNMRSDNGPENVSWKSRAENLAKRRMARGGSHHHAKLPNLCVAEIRSTPRSQVSDRQFARLYQVARTTIRDIRNEKERPYG